MKRFVLFPLAMALSPLAHAICFFNQCDTVAIVDRHYDLGNEYYVQEPKVATSLEGTQHYAVYHSGHYAGSAKPAFEFDLLNTRKACCVKNDLLMTILNVGVKVSLTAQGQSVSLCAEKPNYYWAPYEFRLFVSKKGQNTQLSLSISGASTTCKAQEGEFVTHLDVEDVRSVTLTGDFI